MASTLASPNGGNSYKGTGNSIFPPLRSQQLAKWEQIQHAWWVNCRHCKSGWWQNLIMSTTQRDIYNLQRRNNRRMSHSLIVRAESLSRADLIIRIFRHIMKSWDFHKQEYFFKLFISATGCLFFCTKTKSTSHLNSTFLGIVMAISTIYAPRIIAQPRRGRCLHYYTCHCSWCWQIIIFSLLSLRQWQRPRWSWYIKALVPDSPHTNPTLLTSHIPDSGE